VPPFFKVSNMTVSLSAKDQLIRLGMSPQLAEFFDKYFLTMPESINGDTVGNCAFGPGSMEGVVKSTVDLSLSVPPQTYAKETTGGENTAFGVEALRDHRYGSDCTAVGARACRDNRDAYYNTGIGHYSLGFNIDGMRNTALGAFSLKGEGHQGEAAPQDNVALGFRTMEQVNTAKYNTAIGNTALLNMSDENHNVAVGFSALQQSIDGYANTAIGSGAGLNITSGQKNVCVGLNAGYSLTTGSYNTIIGGDLQTVPATLTDNIWIGNGRNSAKAVFDGADWTLTGDLSTTGAWHPPTVADASADNNSVYYSSDQSKLVYKDPSGTVNALY